MYVYYTHKIVENCNIQKEMLNEIKNKSIQLYTYIRTHV